MNDEQFDALVNLIASYSGRHGTERDRLRAKREARRILVPRGQTKPCDMIGG